MKKSLLLTSLLLTGAIASAQTIQQEYRFSAPKISELNGYHSINFDGCIQKGEVGQPSIPWQSVCLLLPFNQEADSVQIEFTDFTTLPGHYNLIPYQAPRTLSDTTAIIFAIDHEAYQSYKDYPECSKTEVITQYLNGCSIGLAGFTPIRYIPADGQIRYAQNVRVTVFYGNSRNEHSDNLWLTKENEKTVLSIIQNKEELSSYRTRSKAISGYDLLVITSEEYTPYFEEYIHYNNSRGIRTRIATTESLYSNMEGRDNAEKIRNYIKQEYQDNGISMVNLGGDISIIPYRGFYCYISSYLIEYDIPADLYYAALDGTWNDNDNELWGEIGETDFLPEIGVGRMSFNNIDELNHLMHKTMKYQTEPVLGEFRKPILGTEYIDKTYCASIDLEMLIGECYYTDYYTQGMPENYQFVKLYNDEDNWSTQNFVNAINKGSQYVHHIGHANVHTVAGLVNDDIKNSLFYGANGTDHNYFLFYSHGCICGDFAHDCIIEKMLTIDNGAVAATVNSREGWYYQNHSGASVHLHREFVDAYYHERIPFIGLALKEAKIQTAPYIILEPTLMWNYYELNILGDVALCPWLDEPFVPDITYANTLTIGAEVTEVLIKDDGEGLSNFRCSLYQNDELIGFGITNDEGHTTIDFTALTGSSDNLHLIVTGPNAWPQTRNIKVIQQNEGTLLVNGITLHDNGNGNGLAEGNEMFTVDLALENNCNADIININAELSCESEHISILDNHTTIDLLQGNSTLDVNNAFSFQVSSVVPDLSKIYFTINFSDGTHTWTSDFGVRIHAPNLFFTQIVIDDANGNSSLEPGEDVTLHVTGKNIGRVTSQNTILTTTAMAPITISNTSENLGNIEPDGVFHFNVNFVCDDSIHPGEDYYLSMLLSSDNYSAIENYPLNLGSITESFETGDFNLIEWDFSDTFPWTITNEEAHTGDYCARSGVIDDNQISSMIITSEIMNNGGMSFYYKTSTEKKDYLIFYIDDKFVGYWSQENDWTYVTYPIKAGRHTFEWRYDKDKNSSAGADCVWVDDICLPYSSIITNIENTVESKTNALYPNPNTGEFTLELKETSTINIYNQLGQVVYHQEKAEGLYPIRMKSVHAGIYFVRIQSANGNEILKMIIR